MKRITVIASILLCALLTGCEEPGPLERAGEEIDEAFEGNNTPANRADDAVDELRDGINDARDDLNRNR